VIQFIVDELLRHKDLAERYDLKGSKIAHALVSLGGYRKYEASRIVFVIFSGDVPILCVKFYKDRKSNALLERESQIQKTMYERYKNLRIPAVAGLFEINGFKVMVEEMCIG